MDIETLTMYTCEDGEETKVLYEKDSDFPLEIHQRPRFVQLTEKEAKELYCFLGEMLGE